jgi:alanyl-tRNA synthetase
VVLAASVSEGKVSLIAATDERARALGVSAREVLQSALPAVGGKGGGKDDVAQGGGSEPAGLGAALAAATAALRASVGSAG